MRAVSSPRRLASGLLERFRPPARGDAAVLLYHRVAAPEHDAWGNCVDPERFGEHLAAISARFHPISLRELAAGVERGAIPPRSVCVTFDDGYRDNLHEAKPLLERYGVPATVFVVSGYVDSGRNFWWDELERLCFQPQLPRRVRLELPDGVFELKGSRRHGRPISHWRAWHRPRTRGQALHVALYRRLAALDEGRRRAVLEQLAELVEADHSEALTSTGEEIRRLGDGDLVEIGAHTVSHPTLSALPATEQREEIVGAKRDLEHLLGRPVESFAYPHSSYEEQTIEHVRAAGYARACGGGRPEIVTADSPIFAIPRLPAQNWHGRELEKQLSRRLQA